MSLIAMLATDSMFGIGKNGKIPWNCKQDLAVFKRSTLGKTIVMGRKTLESLPKGKPLAGRTNIVLTRKTPENPVEGVVYETDHKKIIELSKTQEVIVIGGSEIYSLFELDFDEIHETSISGGYECDTFCTFDNIDWDKWDCEEVNPPEFNEEGCIAEGIHIFKKYTPEDENSEEF